MSTPELVRPEPGPILTDWAARVVDVVRWVAAAVLVADVLVGLLTIPRDSTLDQFQRDLADGRVRSASVVDPEMLRSTYVLTGHHPGDEPAAVLWRVGTLRYRLAEIPASQSALLEATVLDRAEPDPVLRWSGASTWVLLGLVLVLMVGPQPRHGTKWGVFWILLLPLNAGLIWLMLREAPWAPAARALPVPAPHRFQPAERRFTGGKAFVVLILASLVGRLVLQSLAQHTWVTTCSPASGVAIRATGGGLVWVHAVTRVRRLRPIRAIRRPGPRASPRPAPRHRRGRQSPAGRPRR